jgi:phosphatidylserine/phosphatidylglycerophosphate/cardiolipin synthase-like enzyme
MLLARDVYRSWKRRIQGATESVRVFTPYFDRMLDRLLNNAVLDVGAVSVVADLSPESDALDYRGQLTDVRAILRRGIEVRFMPRLHAKVLFCDSEMATVRSQNFDSYGRGSTETTAVLPDDVSTSDFASTLADWYLAATPVSLELIEVLLAELPEAMSVARQARDQLANVFDGHWDSYLARSERG